MTFTEIRPDIGFSNGYGVPPASRIGLSVKVWTGLVDGSPRLNFCWRCFAAICSRGGRPRPFGMLMLALAAAVSQRQVK